uniref:Uncharacterized protein n=1 Tax=Arundo donax TaxID=35708 RepID=A0A0A9ADB4_ARUDO
MGDLPAAATVARW